MIRVAVTGACGRMGSGIIRRVLEEEDMELVAAIEAPGTPLSGRDIGEFTGRGSVGVEVTDASNLADTLAETEPDVLVDFTVASAAVETIKTSTEAGVNLVVGTTGFSEEEMQTVRDCIGRSGVRAVIAPNMAVGVNVFFKVLRDLAPILSDYDVEIIEAHHRHKKDAPSGTAVRALEVISEATGRRASEVAVHGRSGLTGERSRDEIGVHAVRGGDIVGDHIVLFAGDGERLEIVHRAHSRDAFIGGVIRAIRFIEDAEPGRIMDMGDVLGIN